MNRLSVSIVFFAAAVGASGCGARGGGVDYDKPVTIAAQGTKSVEVDPPKKDQKVSINVSSADVPVDVYVVAKKDADALEQQVLDGKKPKVATLEKKVNTKEASFDVNIPAGTEFTVLLYNSSNKSITVNLKIKG